MTIQKFFEPDKWKVGIAIVIWLIFINTVIFQPYLSGSSGDINYLIIIPVGFVAEIILSIGGVILYPSSCAVISIYRAKKNANPIEDKILTIIGVIIFLVIAYLWIELMLISSAPPPPLKDFSP
jgi:hypothetical protein